MKKLSITIFYLLSCKLFLHSEIIVKTTVNKNKITIGDKIIYSVIIEHSPEINVKFPELETKLGEFEIKDYKVIGPKKKLTLKNFALRIRLKTNYKYIITTFTTGEFKIPPITIEYTNKKGETKKIKSAEITVFVESLKPKDDIRDIKSPVSIPLGWLFYFFLIFIPLLIAIGYYYYQSRKKIEIFVHSDLTRPADEVAYEQLEKLKNLDLVSQGKIKEYYIILSEIIRKYLQQRYSIPVLDRTTNELYHELRDNNEIDKKHCTLIKEFLEDCDLVKFAKYVPEHEIITKNTETAKKIIDLTKPIHQIKETSLCC